MFILLYLKVGKYSAVGKLGHPFIVKKFIVEDEQHYRTCRDGQKRKQRRSHKGWLFDSQTDTDHYDPESDKNQYNASLETDQKYTFFELVGRMVELDCRLAAKLYFVICCFDLDWFALFWSLAHLVDEDDEDD